MKAKLTQIFFAALPVAIILATIAPKIKW